MELVLKSLGFIISLIGLVYLSIKNHRDSVSHKREIIKSNIEILNSLEASNDDKSAYQKIRRQTSQLIGNTYFELDPYYPGWFRLGLIIYFGSGLIGYALMVTDKSFWFVLLSFSITMLGWWLQNRALTPSMSGKHEILNFKDSSKT